MEQLRRRVLDDQLPGALCTGEMRKAVDEAAKRLGVSEAALIRAAVDIFLREHLNQIEEQLIAERAEVAERKAARKKKGKKGSANVQQTSNP